MDFRRLYLISLSRVCAYLISLSRVCDSQQLVLYDGRGPIKQDILGHLKVEKVLLEMHRSIFMCWGLERHPLAGLKRQHESQKDLVR